MIKHLLGKDVVTNASGANLLNGVISSIITAPPADWGVFEIDENTLPQVLKFMNPKVIVLLNLFRDQLDRYGEVDTIADNWKKALANFPGQLIINADDPLVASLGTKNTIYFGLEDTKLFQKIPEHAMDSQFCPACGNRLSYAGHFYSHIGHWSCPNCGLKRPKPQFTNTKYPLMGTYNKYNTLAAIAVAKFLGLDPDLSGLHPAFGRQERIGDVTIFLSKNPAGFNESLRTVLELNAKNILLALNDRIPDGRDVSWIWDVDFEMLPKTANLYVTGDRALDMALRLKYAGFKSQIVTNIPKIENLFILPTYSAMLEIRQELTGRKIL